MSDINDRLSHLKKRANTRIAALQAIDVLISDPHNIQKLYDAFQERLDEEPSDFFREFILPTLPKDSLTTSDDMTPHDQAVEVQEILGAMNDAVAMDDDWEGLEDIFDESADEKS